MKKIEEFIDSIKYFMNYGEEDLRNLEKEINKYLEDDDVVKTDKQIEYLEDLLNGLKEEIYERYDREPEEPIDEEKYYYGLGVED